MNTGNEAGISKMNAGKKTINNEVTTRTIVQRLTNGHEAQPELDY